jgi:hypothetical protein
MAAGKKSEKATRRGNAPSAAKLDEMNHLADPTPLQLRP